MLSLPSDSCFIIPLDCVINAFFLITIEAHRILSVSLGMNFNAAFPVSCVNMWTQYISLVWPFYFPFLPNFVLAVVSFYICCTFFPSPSRNVTALKFVYFVIYSQILTFCISSLCNSSCSCFLNIVYTFF